ncbi:MAG: helix-turn-helix domain-containing protein [Oscillospiraceae bacterium]|nr:helix-turn-helix domain-containing protein [Oscillospiraceae bacterium]
MSSRIFQSIIAQLKDATTLSIGVIDPNGMIVASSELSYVGISAGFVPPFFGDDIEKIIKFGGKTFKALGTGASDDYILFVEGEDEFSKTICKMAAVAINEAGIFYEVSHDKRTFLRHLLSENVLPLDLAVRANEQNLDIDTPRAIFVVRNAGVSAAVVELLVEFLPDKQKDFAISLNDTDIAIILELDSSIDNEKIYAFAKNIKETLEKILPTATVIGIGAIAQNMIELPIRYKEALTALEVGRVFESEESILCYETLGIGRLIYQMPTTLCEMFMSEVFKINPIEALDKETLFTIDKFFENSLNVSETSRKLFVHRNTLVYRLDKIKKITGLDLREFDHAIIFKVALMVKKYLVSLESKR